MKTLVTILIVGILIVGSIFLWARKPKTMAVYSDNSAATVFVGSHEWNMVFGGHDKLLDLLNVYSITDCKDKEIFFRSGLSYMNQRDSVYHELLHANTCDDLGNVHNLYYNSDTENGHEGIYKITDFTVTLLHNNPELAHYLAGN